MPEVIPDQAGLLKFKRNGKNTSYTVSYTPYFIIVYFPFSGGRLEITMDNGIQPFSHRSMQ